MPEPHKGESRDAWMDRCMGDPEQRRSFPDQAQRAAVCESKYAEFHKKEKKESATLAPRTPEKKTMIVDDLAAYIAVMEDAGRCYLQLAAWADAAMRHRSAKYFYERAKDHRGRVKHVAKLIVDLGGGAVTYGALDAPSEPMPAGADMPEWFAAALAAEQDGLANLRKLVADAAAEGAWQVVQNKHIKDMLDGGRRLVAHLVRKVTNLREAAGDVAALQSFDHRL